jgi:hypothetical protein
MPWLPDFVSAVELARLSSRAAGLADPVTRYVAAVQKGDVRDLLPSVFPDTCRASPR